MLKSAELHETILTPVICHKHVRCHDGVTLYFSVKFPSVVLKGALDGREVDRRVYISRATRGGKSTSMAHFTMLSSINISIRPPLIARLV